MADQPRNARTDHAWLAFCFFFVVAELAVLARIMNLYYRQ